MKKITIKKNTGTQDCHRAERRAWTDYLVIELEDGVEVSFSRYRWADSYSSQILVKHPDGTFTGGMCYARRELEAEALATAGITWSEVYAAQEAHGLTD